MFKKMTMLILSAAILSGCSGVKTVESSQGVNVAPPSAVNKAVEEQIESKQENKEDNIKIEQEAKAKEEAQQAVKAEVKPVEKPAPKPVPKPVQQTPAPAPVQNSTSTSGIKHPVEYKASIEDEILILVNQERAKVGAKPMAMNETLRTMARYKSNDMLQYDYFDHTSPNIGGLSTLAKKFNYSYTTLGENIWMSKASSADYLRQNTTAERIMNGWMNSPGHKANILNPAFRRIGIGVTLSTDGLSHATQEFSN